MNNTNSFFKGQPDYTVPKAQSNYTTIEVDETVKLRVLGQAITGYSYFNKDNKPTRQEHPFKGIPKDLGERDGKPNAIKHFWAMVVWNYNLDMIQIWEVPQSTIHSALYAYAMDDDFGDLRNYDIKITRTGKKLETKYMIKPLAPKATPEEAIEALKSNPVTLEALYTGQNPFERDVVLIDQVDTPEESPEEYEEDIQIQPDFAELLEGQPL